MAKAKAKDQEKATAKKTTPKKTKAKETEVVAEVVETEVVAEVKAKKPKKVRPLIKIHHELSPSRGGKVQLRLKGNSTGKNSWGHKQRSQAAKIDELVNTGRYSLQEIQIMSGARTKGRIYNHLKALKEKGFAVLNENGKVKFA